MSCGEIEWHLKNDPLFQERKQITIDVEKLIEKLKNLDEEQIYKLVRTISSIMEE
jgi:hypothetical protein